MSDRPRIATFHRAMRLVGWLLAALAMLYPVAAFEAWRSGVVPMKPPISAFHVVCWYSFEGWLGLQAGLWSGVWLVIGGVRWVVYRRKGLSLSVASRWVLIAVLLGLAVVLGTCQVMVRRFGVMIG